MLELKDVRFSVTDEKGQLKNIINGINLKIDEGKFVAITGPNGSGKSTTCKINCWYYKAKHQARFYIMGRILRKCQLQTEQSLE
mgnify:CR=1 FL=1